MKKTISTFATLLAFCLAVSANNAITTGYFNDGYLYKHRLNPALTPNQGYISMPLLNITAEMGGNCGVINFLTTPADKTNNLLNKYIGEQNPLKLDLGLGVLSTGFYNKKGTVYSTIELELGANLNGMLPEGAFKFMQSDTDDQGFGFPENFNLSGTRINVAAGATISFGQSYKIGNKVKFGYKAKLINSAAQLDINYNKFEMVTTKGPGNEFQSIVATVDGYMNVSGISFGKDSDNNIDMTKLSYGKANFKNMGFGFDLGVSYDVLDWLNLSASVTDLGAIFYTDMLKGIQSSKVSIYAEDIIANGSNNMDEYTQKLASIMKFKDSGNTKLNAMLPATLRAGVQLRLPMYQKFSFGVLYTQQFSKNTGWYEVRGSANYDALRWLALSVSYGYGTFGSQFGALLTIHCNGFNLFAGADAIPFKYDNGLPAGKNSRLAAQLGLSFQFGKYYGRYPKKN